MNESRSITTAPLFTIRQLTISDAEALATFYNQLSAESLRTFRPIGPITIPEKCRKIAEENEPKGPELASKYDVVALYQQQIIGWSFIWDLNTEEPTFGLAVADAYHHQGVGTTLTKHVMAWARQHHLPEVHLTVVQDNIIAWKLYAKQGFVRIGEFTGDDGQPYYRMVVHF